MALKLAELAELTGTELKGDGETLIETVADIKSASIGSISFVSDTKYSKFITETSASALIVTAELAASCEMPVLVSSDPRLVYARVANILFPPERFEAGISQAACISQSAKLADGVRVEPGAVISDDVIIGESCYIGANVVIEAGASVGANTIVRSNATIGAGCKVGQNCLLHSGCVLGADGFGFVRHDSDTGTVNIKIPQTGSVIVGDDVEIGACTSIDRGALDDTVISDGVKLDNQIQIGHSVRIGDNSIISAATAIAGSTVIGKDCMIGGCVAIREHLQIADRVMITGRTLVTHSVSQDGACVSSGTPMDDTVTWRKNSARFRQLDKLARKLAALEKKIQSAEEQK